MHFWKGNSYKKRREEKKTFSWNGYLTWLFNILTRTIFAVFEAAGSEIVTDPRRPSFGEAEMLFFCCEAHV